MAIHGRIDQTRHVNVGSLSEHFLVRFLSYTPKLTQDNAENTSRQIIGLDDHAREVGASSNAVISRREAASKNKVPARSTRLNSGEMDSRLIFALVPDEG